jgi:acetyltransferase-like isoleucine patch superfamily enzyme
MHLGSPFYERPELEKAGFASLGENVLIKKTCGLFFTQNMRIGSHVRIDDFTIIVASGSCSIGSYVHIASHCYLAASHGIEMADFSGLAPGVKIFSGSDDYSGEKLTNPMVDHTLTGGPNGVVRLNRHVIIGAGSVILPNLTIGEGASVGALTLVRKSLDPWGIYVGNPLRKLRDRKKDLLQLEAKLMSEKKIS